MSSSSTPVVPLKGTKISYGPLLLGAAAVIVLAAAVILIVVYVTRKSSSSSASGSSSVPPTPPVPPFPSGVAVTIQAANQLYLTACNSLSDCMNLAPSPHSPINCTGDGSYGSAVYFDILYLSTNPNWENQIWVMYVNSDNTVYFENQKTEYYLNLCNGCSTAGCSDPGSFTLCCSSQSNDLGSINKFYLEPITGTSPTQYNMVVYYNPGSGENPYYLSVCTGCCYPNVSYKYLPFLYLDPEIAGPSSSNFIITEI